MSKETITRCEKQKPRFHAFLKVSVCRTNSMSRTCGLLPCSTECSRWKDVKLWKLEEMQTPLGETEIERIWTSIPQPPPKTLSEKVWVPSLLNSFQGGLITCICCWKKVSPKYMSSLFCEDNWSCCFDWSPPCETCLSQTAFNFSWAAVKLQGGRISQHSHD